MRTLLIAILLLPGMAWAQDDTAWVRDDPPARKHVQPVQPQQEPAPAETQPLIATNPQQPIPPQRVPRAMARQPVQAQPTFAQQPDYPPQPQQPLVGGNDDTDDPDTQPQQYATTSALAACPPIDLPTPNWTGAIIYGMNPQKEQCIPCRNLDKMLLAAGCTLGSFRRNPGANFIHVYLKDKQAFVRRNLVEAPTVIFFVNGEESGRQSGFESTPEEIKSIIAKHPMSRAVRNAKALLRSVGQGGDDDYPPPPPDDVSYASEDSERARWQRQRIAEGARQFDERFQRQMDREWDAYRYGGTQSSYRYGGTQAAWRYGGTQSAYRYGGTQSAYRYGGTQSAYNPSGQWQSYIAYPVQQTFYANDSNLVSSYPVSYGSGNMVCGPNGCQFVR
jgi:hypothetical protein